MSERDDGGPAFPTEPNTQSGRFKHHGMTLRDWFAGLALRAVLDTDDYNIAEGRRLLAINCYAIADAMLAERSRP